MTFTYIEMLHEIMKHTIKQYVFDNETDEQQRSYNERI